MIPDASPPLAADKPADQPDQASPLIRYLRLQPKWRTPVLALLLLSVAAATLGLAYVCWFLFLPAAWDWGFYPATWRGILSVLAALYLAIIPFLPIGISAGWIGDIFELYVDDQERAIRERFVQMQEPQESIEVELEKNDKSRLIPLIRYSRLQLEAYYSIGLSQTQRSFRYSVVAMWIGFAIIVGGILLRIVPKSDAGAGDLHVITVASGTIVELISALFLWVYRSSMTQLNYFYNRQMVLHSILLCDRLSDAMTTPDAMKKLIIESVLQHTWNSSDPAGEILPVTRRRKRAAAEKP